MPEEASLCLYNKWRAGDRDVPPAAATEEAVGQIFAEAWEAPDGTVTPCRQEESEWGAVVCSFGLGQQHHRRHACGHGTDRRVGRGGGRPARQPARLGPG